MKDIFDRAFDDLGHFFDRGIFTLGTCDYTSDKLRADGKKSEDGSYVITVEVPGLSSEKIDISYEDSILSITADYGEQEEGSLRAGKFSKSYRLPEMDSDKITATMSNGILTIELPRSESSKSKKIKIN